LFGWSIRRTLSKAYLETARLGMRIFWFRPVHAWRNSKIRSGRRVDTHGISVFIDLAAFRLRPIERKPKIIAQTIWLFDLEDSALEEMVSFSVSRTGGIITVIRQRI